MRVHLQKRANVVCEACGDPAPFVTLDGRPYLEPHHIQGLLEGGPDDPRWLAARCTNCHLLSLRELTHSLAEQ